MLNFYPIAAFIFLCLFCSGPGYLFYSRSIHPFTALMWINGQTGSTSDSYVISVCLQNKNLPILNNLSQKNKF